MLNNFKTDIQVPLHKYSKVPILCKSCQALLKISATQIGKFYYLEMSMMDLASSQGMLLVKFDYLERNVFRLVFNWLDIFPQVCTHLIFLLLLLTVGITLPTVRCTPLTVLCVPLTVVCTHHQRYRYTVNSRIVHTANGLGTPLTVICTHRQRSHVHR